MAYILLYNMLLQYYIIAFVICIFYRVRNILITRKCACYDGNGTRRKMSHAAHKLFKQAAPAGLFYLNRPALTS